MVVVAVVTMSSVVVAVEDSVLNGAVDSVGEPTTIVAELEISGAEVAEVMPSAELLEDSAVRGTKDDDDDVVVVVVVIADGVVGTTIGETVVVVRVETGASDISDDSVVASVVGEFDVSAIVMVSRTNSTMDVSTV